MQLAWSHLGSYSGLIAILAISGCSGSGDSIVPVSGTITVNGKPAANLLVQFNPVPRGMNGPASRGFTDEAGHYTLQTTVGRFKKGAWIGEHRVTIFGAESVPNFEFWSPPPGPPGEPQPQPTEPLPAVSVPRASQPFTFEVPTGGTRSADFSF